MRICAQQGERRNIHHPSASNVILLITLGLFLHLGYNATVRFPSGEKNEAMQKKLVSSPLFRGPSENGCRRKKRRPAVRVYRFAAPGARSACQLPAARRQKWLPGGGWCGRSGRRLHRVPDKTRFFAAFGALWRLLGVADDGKRKPASPRDEPEPEQGRKKVWSCPWLSSSMGFGVC